MRKYIATGLTLLLLALAGVVIAQDGVGGVDSSSSTAISCDESTDNPHQSDTDGSEITVKARTSCNAVVDEVYAKATLQRQECNTTCYWLTIGTGENTYDQDDAQYVVAVAVGNCTGTKETYRGLGVHRAKKGGSTIYSSTSVSNTAEVTC